MFRCWNDSLYANVNVHFEVADIGDMHNKTCVKAAVQNKSASMSCPFSHYVKKQIAGLFEVRLTNNE